MTIKERVSFPTTTPEETMPLVIDFFKQYQADLAGIGIGSFGPIDIHRDSATYGYLPRPRNWHGKILISSVP
ncbi:ROK family protein [Enterococcus faecium]|uniref:ROK family protein n=1 Tax=Enterococcus faecium TaxID=1352 RepID=UPI0021D248E5|nr:ROK family protein [Enterococcus faecium]MCU4680128.1 ROK family protein [Enterococcus faecium]